MVSVCPAYSFGRGSSVWSGSSRSCCNVTRSLTSFGTVPFGPVLCKRSLNWLRDDGIWTVTLLRGGAA